MNKFKSKKGFTLAELLIVVAIIAVLIAIAVPLFVSGLNKAKEGVYDANKRSLKAAAIIAILNDETIDINKVTTVYATAKVSSKTGEITDLAIVTTKPKEAEDTYTYSQWYASTDGAMAVEITKTDLTLSSVPEDLKPATT